jgi:hypothetical protein
MSELLTSLQRAPETSTFEPRPPIVRTFLAAPDLSTEHRQRLTGLVAVAETELRRLAA